MHSTKGGGMPAQAGDRDAMYRAIVAELASVIAHVRKSRELLESAIAADATAEDAAADNIIVLDDVTPGYERVDAALRECAAGPERRPSPAAGTHGVRRRGSQICLKTGLPENRSV